MKYYSAMFHKRFFEIKNKKCSRNKKHKSKNWRTKMFVKYYSVMFYKRFFEIKNKNLENKKVCKISFEMIKTLKNHHPTHFSTNINATWHSATQYDMAQHNTI